MALSSLFSYSVYGASGALNINYQILDSELFPGQETSVFLTFSTTTSIAVRDIIYTVSPGPYLTSDAVLVNLGALGGISNQQTSFKIKASDNAVTTISYVVVKATYKDDQGDKELNLNIPVNIVRNPLVQINFVEYGKPIVEPGSTLNLLIGITNRGDGPAKEVMLTLNQSPQTFTIVGSSKQVFVGDVGAGVSKSINYTIAINPNAAVGVYSVPVLISYKDESKTKSYSSDEAIGMVIMGTNKILLIKNSQDVIVPGGSGNINIETVNLGTQGARFLTIGFTAPEGISVSPAQIFTGSLDSDDSDTARLGVAASDSIVPGTYTIKADVTYSDIFSKTHSQSLEFPVEISGKQKKFELNAPEIAAIIAAVLVALKLIGKKKARK